MTNRRTQKLALISALWMLFAFISPMIAPACAMMSPELCATELQAPAKSKKAAACCNLQALHNKKSHCDLRLVAQTVQTPTASCCCAHNSPPTLQAVVVQTTTHRVLDVGADAFATIARTPHIISQNRKVSWLATRETRRCSPENPPPSGRAPPAVWS